MKKNPVVSSSTTVAPSDINTSSSVIPLPSTAASSAATVPTASSTAVTESVRSLNESKGTVAFAPPKSQKHEEKESSIAESVSSKSPHHHHHHKHDKKHHGHDHEDHHHHHHPHSHSHKHHKHHKHKRGSSSDTDNESQATSTTSKTVSYLDDIEMLTKAKLLHDQIEYLKQQRLKAKQLERRIDPEKISVVSSSVSSVAVTEDESVKGSSLKEPPKVEMSHTGLIDAIGRPFNENHQKYLAILSPGNEFMLTRRASEVHLRQLPIIADFDLEVLERFEKLVKIFSWTILGVGIAFFILLVCAGSIETPMEYKLFFFQTHPTCLAIFIFATIQPFAVAPGCRYAVVNLKHIRTYYIRVPPSLVLHFAVVIISIVLMNNAGSDKGGMYLFLEMRMMQYYKHGLTGNRAKEDWDSIQTTYSCCGIDNYEDWAHHTQQTALPKSCCETTSAPCSQNSPSLYRKGCRGAYEGGNIAMSSLFFILSLATIIIQGLSALLMLKFWRYIGHELYDDRSALSIFGGKFCSLCTIEDSDAEVDDDGDASENMSFRGKSRLIVKKIEHSPDDESVTSVALSQDPELHSQKSILQTSSIMSLKEAPSEHNSQQSQSQSQLTESASATTGSVSVKSFRGRQNKVGPTPAPRQPPITRPPPKPTPAPPPHHNVAPK